MSPTRTRKGTTGAASGTLYEREYRERVTPGADQPEAGIHDHIVDELEIERWSNEVLYELVVAGRSLDEAMSLANRDTSDLGEEERPASLPPEPTKRAPATPKPLELRVFGPNGEIQRSEAGMETARAQRAQAEIDRIRARSRRRRDGATPQTLAKTKRPADWASSRKYPAAKVGDLVGPFRVIEILAPDLSRNERVIVTCERGHKRVSYSFNLRKRTRCARCPKTSVVLGSETTVRMGEPAGPAGWSSPVIRYDTAGRGDPHRGDRVRLRVTEEPGPPCTGARRRRAGRRPRF